MNCTVNGKQIDLADGTTLMQLLVSRNLNPDRVVVELNRAIVTRAEFETWEIHAGSEIEILSFVGGGYHA